ncbi:MAG: transporter [Marmoricola sp.]|nr:transporter [Marmoricola sp.]
MTTTGAIATPTAAAATSPAPHRTAILWIVLISYFMIILDVSIVFTGLTHMREDVGFSTTGLAWVQSAYTLTFGGLLLLGARAGDIIGRRNTFIIGLVIFTGASLLVGIGQSDWWVIGSRALQGVGAAILAPSTLSLLTATFPEGRERTRAVSLYAAVAGIGASLGLVIGGALADLVSWRAGFLINIPIGAIMIVMAMKFLVQPMPIPGKFDLIGALLSTVGMGLLIYGVVDSSNAGWDAPSTLVCVIGGGALVVLFVLNEWRAKQPIMPLRLFSSPYRTGAYAIRFLYLGAMAGFFYFTSQLLQDAFGWNPLQAGLGYLPMTAVNFAVAMAAPALGRRFSGATLLAAGVVSTLAGMYWLSYVQPGDSYITAIALPMILIGIGQGLAFAPMTSFGIDGLPARDAGAASGLLNTVHQLGNCVGLAVLVTLGANATGSSPVAIVASQVHIAFTGSSVLLALATVVILAVILPAELRRRRTATAL